MTTHAAKGLTENDFIMAAKVCGCGCQGVGVIMAAKVGVCV